MNRHGVVYTELTVVVTVSDLIVLGLIVLFFTQLHLCHAMWMPKQCAM